MLEAYNSVLDPELARGFKAGQTNVARPPGRGVRVYVAGGGELNQAADTGRGSQPVFHLMVVNQSRLPLTGSRVAGMRFFCPQLLQIRTRDSPLLSLFSEALDFTDPECLP